ncbi:small-conductance mechanosensitive channel [Enterococcus sp. PF1-24]|uniref:hypothetical protein n=1 Tax=unclassified Enterococcus TaxID=2608891 RepID=UPI0024758844|nr:MULTISPECIES: hypothetical protein [unclassified Enterococcus]MDH6363416.1 small-conductance mechanosensitive channel [Enterococcus sp. PFB1-1]MDH6400510.1 small-conductance mechanosensitive channel [Enterococcus sp. PF1-24]
MNIPDLQETVSLLVIEMIVYYVFLVILSQAIVEKRGLPKKIATVKLRYILLVSLLLIALSIIVGTWLHIAGPLAATVTILTSAVITYKYREKYSEMEQGKNV